MESRNKTCKHPTCNGKCRRPAKPLKQRSRIRPASKKRVKQLRKYGKNKRDNFEEGTVCAIVEKMQEYQQYKELFKDCQYFATDYHHPAGKIEYELLTKEVIPLCRSCHRIVEEKPLLAKEIGLSKSRLIKTS